MRANPQHRVYRERPRRGCMPMTLFSGILFGVVIALIAWVGGRLGVVNLPGSTLGQAHYAFSSGDLDRTIELAQQAWLRDGENSEALSLLVRALIYRSYEDHNHTPDQATALRFTTEAIADAPYTPDLMAVHAFALQANSNAVEAARFAEAALNKQPENNLARVALGLAYGRVGSYNNALAQNETAIARSRQGDAHKLDAYRAQAISLSDLGRYEEAFSVVQQAIALNERLLVLYFEQALYAIQVGDVDAATASYFRILAFDPENVKARLRLCELSTMLRETEAAINYCREVTEMAPNWVDGWYRLGREYFLQGDFAMAQQYLNQCTTRSVAQNIPIERRQFECWYLQGQAAEIQGNCEALLSVYREFRIMADLADLPQTWTYPPEGPPICTS